MARESVILFGRIICLGVDGESAGFRLREHPRHMHVSFWEKDLTGLMGALRPQSPALLAAGAFGGNLFYVLWYEGFFGRRGGGAFVVDSSGLIAGRSKG